MVTKSNYSYREDSKGWGNNPRNVTRHDSLHMQLMQLTPSPFSPAAWDDVSNFKGKNVWGTFDGTHQLLTVVSRAPEGNEGERWYVMPSRGHKANIFSVSKSKLELQPKPCTALMIVPSMAIVVYTGSQI